MMTLHFVHMILDNPGVFVLIEDHEINGQASRMENDVILISRIKAILNILGVYYEVRNHVYIMGLPRNIEYTYPSLQEMMDADYKFRSDRDFDFARKGIKYI